MIHLIPCTPAYQRRKISIFLMLLLSTLPRFNYTLEAQIGRYSKIDKLEKHSFNFETISNKEIKQKKDKGLYTVFSDRADNKVYFSAYAQIEGDKQQFLTPYYVVNQKDDYLELVAKNPDIIGKPKGLFSLFYGDKYTFSKHKAAKYIGWIHKDFVLEYAHPKLSPYNYKPIRYVVGVHDLKTLYNIENHVKNDSVFLFKDPNFQTKNTKALHLDQFVYLYKHSVDEKAVLVSNLDNMKPEDSTTRTMGWIPKDFMKKVGQQRVYALADADSIGFLNEDYKSVEYVQKKDIGANLIFDLSAHRKNQVTLNDTLQVVQPFDVWDHSGNKLINVDGENVLLANLELIKQENKIINFHYVFDCNADLKQKHLKLMSSLQQIWILLSTNKKYNDFEISFSASSYGCGQFYAFPKSKSFSAWIDFLHNIFMDNGLVTTSIPNTEGLQQCFENAIKELPQQSFTNNIILVAGETKFFNLPDVKRITTKLAQTSSRLIFYQLENKANDKHQEFTLQSKDILNRVSKHHADFIRAYIVDNALIKNENVFSNIPSVDNIYVYDAPKNSSYQGGIAFPKINKALLATSLDTTISSVLSASLKFNSELVNSLEYNASKLGFLRSKPSKTISDLILENPDYANQLGEVPRNDMHEKYYLDKIYAPRDNLKTNTAFLMSKKELVTLVEAYKSLIPLLRKIAKRRDRVQLYKNYRKTSKGINKKIHRKTLRKSDAIADLFFMKTGLPVKDKYLKNTKIKHVKRKRRTSHLDFTKTMKALREKIDVLEQIILNADATFYTDGSGANYYLITDNYIL
ncbi:type VI secretion system protein TssR domain-containing protein [Tamlana sp. I1]|uniref:type VI secretion system protein TssR domain-containing protein n=1 Tax=Tamlana sp. I1 TaxID=2762061 RepID=UPI00188DD8D0|nr:type VI secretion system protein TssR domain-containing protein [Tamlana sp. I1]